MIGDIFALHGTGRAARGVLLSWRSTGTSAAQNGPVIRICDKCGALLLDEAEECSFCRVDAEQNEQDQLEQDHLEQDQVPEAVAVGVAAQAEEPEWRREVSRRLQEYRARRRHLHPDDSQSGLPFHEEAQTEAEEVRLRPRVRPAARQRQNERVEICIQPELDFANPLDRAHPQTALVPVASVAERRTAGIIDAVFLALTFAGFLGLFRSLGGQITLAKMDAIVYLMVAYLLYGLYFVVFTTLAGATPGMQLRGLTIVRLDGSLPDTRQLGWRSFGYLLSGTTLMLGFIWALWDEDHFTWQDRISQTYVTAATPVGDSDAIELPPDIHAARGTFGH